VRGRVTPVAVADWAGVLVELEGMTCAWADLDGFHVAEAPTGQPVATHLWAWAPDRWVTMRIEPDRMWLARLTEADVDDEGGHDLVIHRLQSLTGGRIQHPPAVPLMASMTTLEALPLTFVRQVGG
jgi:hypothetical protein